MRDPLQVSRRRSCESALCPESANSALPFASVINLLQSSKLEMHLLVCLIDLSTT